MLVIISVEIQHWYLDVVFRQDKSRYRNRIGARNLAVLRKIALNGLLREDSLKRGIATKQCAAACNPSYREKVLKKIVLKIHSTERTVEQITRRQGDAEARRRLKIIDNSSNAIA